MNIVRRLKHVSSVRVWGFILFPSSEDWHKEQEISENNSFLLLG